MKGFIYTLDALFGLLFAAALIALVFSLLDFAPVQTHAQAYFASDLVFLSQKAGLSDSQIEALFQENNLCGAFVVFNAEGLAEKNASICGCATPTVTTVPLLEEKKIYQVTTCSR